MPITSFSAENHSLLPADLENFARVAYKIVVILSVEKQIIDIYIACAVYIDDLLFHGQD